MSINLYPETNYLIKSKEISKTFKILFKLNNLKMNFLCKILLKIYLVHLEIKRTKLILIYNSLMGSFKKINHGSIKI